MCSAVDSKVNRIRQIQEAGQMLSTSTMKVCSSLFETKPMINRQAARRLMLEIMGEFGFGQTIGMLSNPAMGSILDNLERFNFWAGVYFQIPWLKHFHLEEILNFLQLGGGGPEWDRWSGELTSHVLDRNIDSNKKGQFSVFLEAKDPVTQESYSDASLRAQGIFLFIAGSDTLGTTISAMLFYLTHYPAAYCRLVEEIRSTFRSVEDICSGPLLQSCHYLTACLNETLRLSPPTVGSPWREVERGGMHLEGEYIPAGVDVAS